MGARIALLWFQNVKILNKVFFLSKAVYMKPNLILKDKDFEN